jgi:hypothetical protein
MNSQINMILAALVNLPDLLTTSEMAKILRISEQTARRWSCYGEGPLQPVRYFARGPLKWRKSDVVAVISGAAPAIMNRTIEA